jgi:preprotein translocase subunit YajC
MTVLVILIALAPALLGMQPSSGQQGGGAMSLFLMMFMIFAIFYFLIIRPQRRAQKTREKMLEAIKKGDRVLTSGGMYGTVVGFKADSVILKIDDQVKIELQKGAIAQVVKESG